MKRIPSSAPNGALLFDQRPEQTFLIAMPQPDLHAARPAPVDLPIASISLVNGDPVVQLDGRTLPDEEVFLRVAALISTSEAGHEITHRLTSRITEIFGAWDVAAEHLQPRDQESAVTEILSTALRTALAERAKAAQRAAGLRRELARARREHDKIQSSFRAVESYLIQTGRGERFPSHHLPPTAQQRSVEMPSGATLTQRLPGASTGLSDVAVFLPQIPETSDGLLEIELRLSGTPDPSRNWQIAAPHLNAGWLRLSLPVSLPRDAQAADLHLSWTGGAPLSLALGMRHPGTRFQAHLDHMPQGYSLALKQWTFVPGCQAPNIANSHYPGPSLRLSLSEELIADPVAAPQENTRSWVLPSEILSAAVNLTPKNRDFKFLPEISALQVHVQKSYQARAVLVDALPAGLKQVTATIKTIADLGPVIEYRIAAGPPPSKGLTGYREITFEQDMASDWHVLPAHTEGQIPLVFDGPLKTQSSLYLMVRLPAGKTDTAWGWSTFSNIQLVG